MLPLDLVKLTALMERTSGSPKVRIGLIDGPVVTQHADLAVEKPPRNSWKKWGHMHSGQ